MPWDGTFLETFLRGKRAQVLLVSHFSEDILQDNGNSLLSSCEDMLMLIRNECGHPFHLHEHIIVVIATYEFPQCVAEISRATAFGMNIDLWLDTAAVDEFRHNQRQNLWISHNR